jgi:hypothetical protein
VGLQRHLYLHEKIHQFVFNNLLAVTEFALPQMRAAAAK